MSQSIYISVIFKNITNCSQAVKYKNSENWKLCWKKKKCFFIVLYNTAISSKNLLAFVYVWFKKLRQYWKLEVNSVNSGM